jgi:hypothetical protein
MRSSIAVLGPLLAFLISGCSERNTVLKAADYVTTCTDSSECVVIGVGDLCDDPCEEAAINVADLDAYHRDRDGIVCSDGPPTIILCEGGSMAVCIEGRCAIY